MELRKRSALFVYVATVSSVTATLACSDKTSVAPEAADASRDAETTDRTKDGRAPITVSDSGTKDAARSRAAPDAETDSASPAKDGGPARSDASLLDAGANDSSDAARACPAPADRSKGKACLVFNPEAIRFEAAPELDGKGTLLVRVFDTDVPGPTTHTLAEVVYPPQADGGAREVSVNELPSLEVDGLPETVYVFAVFADNPAYLELAGGLTYGTFVGGLNLASGLQPTPGFRPVSLPAGVGTVVDMKLTAMRRFTSEVTVALDGGAPLGDGEGPLSVGVFRQEAPAGAQVFGSAAIPCADVARAPIPVSGFFYGSGDNWFGAQLDDFGLGGTTPPGALVSLVAPQFIPAEQKVSVPVDAYSVSIPFLALTAVLPKTPGPDAVSCPAD